MDQYLHSHSAVTTDGLDHSAYLHNTWRYLDVLTGILIVIVWPSLKPKSSFGPEFRAAMPRDASSFTTSSRWRCLHNQKTQQET